MPLVVKNKVIGEKPPQELKPAVSSIEEIRKKEVPIVSTKSIEEVRSPVKPKKVKINRLQDADEVESAALVVNGQKRKLSKNSAYMLDMVSLDDE